MERKGRKGGRKKEEREKGGRERRGEKRKGRGGGERRKKGENVRQWVLRVPDGTYLD